MQIGILYCAKKSKSEQSISYTSYFLEFLNDIGNKNTVFSVISVLFIFVKLPNVYICYENTVFCKNRVMRENIRTIIQKYTL